MNNLKNRINGLQSYLSYEILTNPYNKKVQYHAQYCLLETVNNTDDKKSLNQSLIKVICAMGYTEKEIDEFVSLLISKKEEWKKIDIWINKLTTKR